MQFVGRRELCEGGEAEREILYGVKKERGWGGEMEIDRLPSSWTRLSDVINLAGWWQIGGIPMGNDISLEEVVTCVVMHVCAHVSPWAHKRSHFQILSQFTVLHRKGLVQAPISIYPSWSCMSKQERLSEHLTLPLSNHSLATSA